MENVDHKDNNNVAEEYVNSRLEICDLFAYIQPIEQSGADNRRAKHWKPLVSICLTKSGNLQKTTWNPKFNEITQKTFSMKANVPSKPNSRCQVMFSTASWSASCLWLILAWSGCCASSWFGLASTFGSSAWSSSSNNARSLPCNSCWAPCAKSGFSGAGWAATTFASWTMPTLICSRSQTEIVLV